MPAPLDCFGLLGLTPDFDLDEKTLEARYFQQQRAHHPDRYIGKPQVERNAALQRSADINDAYRLLKDPLTRAQALLSAKGITVGSDHDSIKPSQRTLIENIEWRESIDEAGAGEAQALIASLSQHYSDCLSRISALYRAGNVTEMAQETLRLGYLIKAREAASGKLKREQKAAP